MTFPPIDFIPPGTAVHELAHGRVYEDEWGCYALLTGVIPADLAASPYGQVRGAFDALESELAEGGFAFADVVRTWLYGDHILDWYSELNRARNDFFIEHGVYDRYVPASTGIGWTSNTGACIVLGAFAAKPKKPGGVSFEAIPSPLQCPALEYGSSFSRAAEIRTPGWRRVLVSGTASLVPGSHGVAHVDDITAQVDCTMKAVAAIYESRGMSLSDVTGALIYLKRWEYRAAWEAWMAAHPEYPRAHSRAIVADVCRAEWLFEIESDACRSLCSAGERESLQENQ